MSRPTQQTALARRQAGGFNGRQGAWWVEDIGEIAGTDNVWVRWKKDDFWQKRTKKRCNRLVQLNPALGITPSPAGRPGSGSSMRPGHARAECASVAGAGLCARPRACVTP